MLAIVATSVARAAPPGPARSVIAAVAVPVKMPADRPESTRPRRIRPSPCSSRKATALSAESTRPGSSARRRPMSSESRPKSSSAEITPTA